jgi:hypothetical protein
MNRRILLFIAPLFFAGCSDADAEKLRRVGEKSFDRASQLTRKVWDELGQTLLEQPAAAPALTDLRTRVVQRLVWERDLADLRIDVDAEGDGVILRGQVANAMQRRRAEELAEHTLGVKKVQNDLTVGEQKSPDPEARGK